MGFNVCQEEPEIKISTKKGAYFYYTFCVQYLFCIIINNLHNLSLTGAYHLGDRLLLLNKVYSVQLLEGTSISKLFATKGMIVSQGKGTDEICLHVLYLLLPSVFLCLSLVAFLHLLKYKHVCMTTINTRFKFQIYTS